MQVAAPADDATTSRLAGPAGGSRVAAWRAAIARRERLFLAAVSVVFTVALIGLIWAAGIRDEEEYGLGLYATLLNARQMLSGGGPAFWTNLRGFGTPLPLGQSFYLDPTFYLWPLLPVSAVLTLFWAKMAVGTACLMLWLRRIGASLSMAVLGGFCFTFSIPVANSTVTDDWPSVVSSWSLFPLVLLLISRLPDARRPYLTGLGLGAAAGLWAVDGHPGHLPVFILPAAAYVVALAVAAPRIIGPLAVAALIVCIALLDDATYILQQYRLFPDGIERGGYGPLTLGDWGRSLWRPLSFYDLSEWHKGERFLRFYSDAFKKSSTRYPFIGVGLLAGVVLSLFAFPRLSRIRRAHLAGALAGLAITFALSLAPKTVLGSTTSAMWLFRDGALVMAIAAGTIGLTYLQGLRGGRHALVALAGLQVIQAGATFGEPVLYGICCDSEYGVFPAADDVTPVKQRFLAAAREHGPRVVLSDKLAGAMSLGRFDDQGIHSASDLSLAGVELASGRFKGTSHDEIYPSNGLWGGRIMFPTAAFDNKAMLDIAGIGVVALYRSELEGRSLPAGLVEADAVEDDRHASVVLLANPGAWKRVTLMPPDGELNGLPVARDKAGCAEPALWCTDLFGVPAPLTEQPSDIVAGTTTITARIPPGTGERRALVTQLHRDGWRATIDGRSLPIRPAINGAFFTVPVPPEGGQLVLSYDSGARVWIFWLSFVTLWTAIVAAAVLGLLPVANSSVRPEP